MKKKLKLAVLGSPISHSRSPQLHGIFAKNCGYADFSYERIEVTENELESVIERLVSEEYDGFNCTMPLKTEMARLADELCEESRILSSVNTVAIKNGRLYGFTTDGYGIFHAVRRGYLQIGKADEKICGKKVLLLGAGGAARSAALSLKKAGAEITVCNRSLKSADVLVDMIGGGISIPMGDRAALCDAAEGTDILINCTSLGMIGNAGFENFDFISAMKPHGIVIDAVYNPLETELLKKAEKMGHCGISGLWMLIYQGAAAFEKWTGHFPSEDICACAFEGIK